MKTGDYVVITHNGRGTSPNDIGLFCQIVKDDYINKEYPDYTIEIDRDKIGNRDRYCGPSVLRLATYEEIIKNVKTLTYEIY